MFQLDKAGRSAPTRRDFLLRAGGYGLSAFSLAALAGCGGADNPGQSNTPGINNAALNLPLSGTRERSSADMRALVDAFLALDVPPLNTLTPQAARTQPSIQTAQKAFLARQQSLTPQEVASVRDTTVPGPGGVAIPVRVYTPVGTGPFPIIVYYHGGGWVIATVTTYETSARALCNLANAVVVSVEYRKGPENRFPAAHEDAYAALQYVINNAAQFGGDPTRVATAGESAGGNLATAVCLMARDRGGRLPVYQVPIYPIADNNLNSPSYIENANAVPLNRPLAEYFFANYLNRPTDGDNPLISLVDANLSGLPPATIITAEIDPLRSEGELLAQRLQAAGVSVRYRNYTGATHEFFSLNPTVAAGRDAVQFAVAGLNTAFRR